jgi:hypothetical protein
MMTRNPTLEKEASRIAARGEEINLASHPRFNERFMEFMMF